MALAFVELVIGLSFIYLLLAIACSAAIEWLAERSGVRGKFMRQGLLKLVEDRWFYLRIINHPALVTLYRDVPGRPRPPSYVPPENFATAVLDVILDKAGKLDPTFRKDPTPPQNAQDFAAAARICANFGFAVGYAVLPLVSDAASIDEAKAAIAKWYQTTMDRIGGWYKANTQRRLILLGFLAAAALNVDSIAIAKALLESRSLSSAIADLATAAGPGLGQQIDQKTPDVKQQLQATAEQTYALRTAGLPIGYGCLASGDPSQPTKSIPETVGNCYSGLLAESRLTLVFRLVGWFITAFAVSFGAQFWFDLLNRFVNLRGAGKKPQTA